MEVLTNCFWGRLPLKPTFRDCWKEIPAFSRIITKYHNKPSPLASFKGIPRFIPTHSFRSTSQVKPPFLFWGGGGTDEKSPATRPRHSKAPSETNLSEPRAPHQIDLAEGISGLHPGEASARRPRKRGRRARPGSTEGGLVEFQGGLNPSNRDPMSLTGGCPPPKSDPPLHPGERTPMNKLGLIDIGSTLLCHSHGTVLEDRLPFKGTPNVRFHDNWWEGKIYIQLVYTLAFL